MAGLNATEIDAMVRLVAAINQGGISVLLIEHNMRAVMSLSHRILVLSFGEKISSGTPRDVAADRRVIEAYLGKSMSILLKVDGIQVGYGDMTAVHEASLEVREGETVALIGGNGAGRRRPCARFPDSSRCGPEASSSMASASTASAHPRWSPEASRMCPRAASSSRP